MFLSDTTITKFINEGLIVVKPEFNPKNIRPVGLRLHLAKDILIPEPDQTVELNSATDLKYKEVDLTKSEFSLEPGQFILGATYEAIQTPRNIVALLDGRSTIARLGLTVHVTATVADGTVEQPHVVVLEIKNLGNFKIKLSYKDPIAMMVFAELSEPVQQIAQSQYGGGQSKVTPPNLKFKTGKDR